MITPRQLHKKVNDHFSNNDKGDNDNDNADSDDNEDAEKAVNEKWKWKTLVDNKNKEEKIREIEQKLTDVPAAPTQHTRRWL